jgi:8-oxo-dGTP diphosphatase
VAVAYFALLPAGCPDCAHPPLEWHPVEALPPLAGGNGEILAYAQRRLRYKLEYSAVGFQLLPEHFSLSELQGTYEMILGETLDKRNFRRRILTAGIIEPTQTLRGGEGRPARLYRYRPDAVAEVKTRRLFP